MIGKEQDIFTTVVVAGTLTITQDMGITVVAMKLMSGSGSYSGNKRLSDGVGTDVPSTPIPLAVGDPVTISSEQTKYIDNLIIDGSAGQIQVIAR